MMQRAKQCVQRVVDRREHGRSQRPHRQRDRVQDSDERAAEDGRDQAGNQEVVLQGLPFLVAVPLQTLRAALTLRLPTAQEVVQRSQRANPAAEEPAQEESGNQNRQAPEESAIERVARKGAGESREGVKLEEEADGVGKARSVTHGAQRAEAFRLHHQKEKEQQKQNLR